MEGKFLWFFCAVVAISFARTIPVEDGENSELLAEESFRIEPHIFENKILEAINKLKDFLKNGDPSSGVPPLDPYFLPYKAFDFYIMDTEQNNPFGYYHELGNIHIMWSATLRKASSRLKGFFQDTTFANFSRFQPENMEFKLLPLHFKVDLFLDQFRISGRYKMQGKILNQFPINGTGKFISDTKNLTVSLYIKPTAVNSSFQIKDLIIEFKTLSEKINYTNELVDDKVHELDENLALYILDQAQAKYVPPLLAMVKTVLNHFLLGYSYNEILKIILDFLNKH